MLFALVACAPEPVDEEEPLTPSAWAWEPAAADDAALLTEPELDEAVDEVVAAIVHANPRYVPDAFQAALQHVEDGCPNRESTNSQTFVQGDCTTSDGWSWYGDGLVSRIRNLHIALGDIDSWHRVWDYTTGNVQAWGPDGEHYGFLGYSWYRDWDDDDDRRVVTVELWGEFQMADVPTYADTWMGEGRAVELYAEMTEEGGGSVGTWNGGFSRLSGPAWAFVLDDLALSSAEGGCASEPTGLLQLQDQAGTWYDVVFDGDVACDGCGAVTSGGEDVGQACGDWTPLSVWETDPWAG